MTDLNTSDVSVISIIQGGLVLGCTLVWSEVIKSGAGYMFAGNQEKVIEIQILYAIILTIIVVLIFKFLSKTKSELAKIQTQINSENIEMKKIKSLSTSFR